MRTFLLVGGTAALLIAVFVGYWWMQPPTSVSRAPETVAVPTPPPSGERNSPLGRGENAGVMMFDPKTGELSGVFDTAEFEPIGNDQVRVVKPVALFYLKDQQRIRIRGEEGVVWHSGTGSSGAQLSRDGFRVDRSRPPSRGQLKDVVIDLFEGEGDIADLEPVLTVNLDNAAFDNDTYRIFTEDAEINGVFVPADQVPITGRGRDYEFDGRGLVIQWNEGGRRLDLLRVAHGERLVIRNPKLLAGRKTAAALPLPLKLVSTDAADAAQALPTTASADRYTVYRAVFDHAVRISQDGKPIAIADNMVIDLAMQSGLPRATDDTDASASAALPDAAAVAPAETSETPPGDASANAAPTAEPTTDEATAKTDAPGLSDSPIVVEWAGPLVITPAPETDTPPPPREAIVRLAGNPVQLAYDGHAVEAGLAVFETARTGIQLEPVAGQSLRLHSADGQTLETTYVRGQIDDSFVVLGPGASTDPINNAGARWTDYCTLHLLRRDDGGVNVESAELVGNVKIEHPSLDLSADRSVRVALADTGDLANTDNAAREAIPLRHLRAEGNVVCLLTDGDGQTQRVQGDLLELETEVDADSRRYPRRLAMEGSVLIEDATGTIRTSTLSALLNPAPADASAPNGDDEPFQLKGIVIEKIDAGGGVQFETPDGQFALADNLVITEDAMGRHLTLTDDNGASIGSGDSTLSGREISLHQQSRQVRVSGAGAMETVRVEPDGRQRPITVEWQDSMDFDELANTVVASGDIVVLTTEADGTVQTITGDRLSAELVDRAKPADEEKEPANELTAGMGRKGVSKIRLTDNVEVRSLMSDAADAVLRRLHVTTPSVEYDAQAGTLLAPSAGRLLYEDHRKKDADNADEAFSSPEGTIAMRWAGQARFVQADGQIAIEKDVVVVYQADAVEGKQAEAFRIDTPRLVVDMAADSSDNARPELKRVIAENARFAATDVELQADRLVYDHARKVVIVTGTDAAPVEVFRGAHAGRWQSLTYDVEKDRIVEMTRAGAR